MMPPATNATQFLLFSPNIEILFQSMPGGTGLPRSFFVFEPIGGGIAPYSTFLEDSKPQYNTCLFANRRSSGWPREAEASREKSRSYLGLRHRAASGRFIHHDSSDIYQRPLSPSATDDRHRVCAVAFPAATHATLVLLPVRLHRVGGQLPQRRTLWQSRYRLIRDSVPPPQEKPSHSCPAGDRPALAIARPEAIPGR
jgi:hypothetical protein